MQFGIIGRMVAWMRQVVEFGDRSTGRGTFGGEFGARMGTSQKPISPSLCHHMATVMLSCCSVVPNSDKLPPDILARNVTLQPKIKHQSDPPVKIAALVVLKSAGFPNGPKMRFLH